MNIDKCVSEFRVKCQKNMQNVARKRCLSDTERDNSSVIQDGRKRGEEVCSKLFIIPCSSQLDKNTVLSIPPSKNHGKHNSFNGSGYISLKPLTPILPKQSNSDISASKPSAADSTDAIVQSKSDSLGDECPADGDHTYSCQISKETLPPKKQTSKLKSTSKTNFEPVTCNSLAYQQLNSLLLRSDHSENNDHLSNAELSTIISILSLRSRRELVKSLLDFDYFCNIIEDVTLTKLSKNCDILSNRKRGRLSVLVAKEYEDLKTFEWNEVITELLNEFPLLAKTFLAFLLPDSLSDGAKMDRLSTLIPRIGFLYAVLAQGRNQELSRVQRMIDILLFDSICDQKVFDRLNPLGICLSYSHSVRIMDKIASH